MSQSRFAFLNGIPPIGEWPDIDLNCLEDKECCLAERRMRALQMYVDGKSHEDIRATTGIRRSEVHRLLQRCLTLAADGRIFGMRALVPGTRVVEYERTAPVTCSPGEANHGSAGALGQLFRRFPELQRFIHNAYLQTTPRHKGADVRIRVSDLHHKFIRWLEEHGLQQSEWPRNTSTEGLEALRSYCDGLSTKFPEKWVRARAGRNAAARLTVGRGIPPIMPMLRPFGAVQLDFHKVDSACTISITNPFGAEIQLPLPRWHIGLLIEERFELIIGAVLALEITPSSDSVLETIESALIPIVVGSEGAALAIGMGRRIFPNQLFRSLGAGQCFSILRMDNGWSNTARDVIDNVIDTVGCAVHFGPVRAWWGRDAIERIFGQITRSGAQRSPATFGNGPTDSRKDKPAQQAMRLDIRLSDLICAIEGQIALHNASRTGALLMGSPLAALEASMNTPGSGFIPSQLPASTQELPLLMYHIEIVTVRGSRGKGERPYVKLGQWRYTNERLTNDFGFLGLHLKAYCSRRDACIVYASCIETGESLGRLLPPNRWLEIEISWRARGLLQRAGSNQRRAERREMHADEWLDACADTPASEVLGSTVQRGMGKRALSITKAAAKQLAKAPVAKPPTSKPAASKPAAESGFPEKAPMPFSLDGKVNIERVYQGDTSWSGRKAQ